MLAFGCVDSLYTVPPCTALVAGNPLLLFYAPELFQVNFLPEGFAFMLTFALPLLTTAFVAVPAVEPLLCMMLCCTFSTSAQKAYCLNCDLRSGLPGCLQTLGTSQNYSLLSAVTQGASKVFGNVMAIILVDRVGRKKLQVFGEV